MIYWFWIIELCILNILDDCTDITVPIFPNPKIPDESFCTTPASQSDVNPKFVSAPSHLLPRQSLTQWGWSLNQPITIIMNSEFTWIYRFFGVHHGYGQPPMSRMFRVKQSIRVLQASTEMLSIEGVGDWTLALPLSAVTRGANTSTLNPNRTTTYCRKSSSSLESPQDLAVHIFFAFVLHILHGFSYLLLKSL